MVMSLPNKEKYKKFKPLKIFGQNFLVDDNIAAKIVGCLNITMDDYVVEIGAGYGALTKHILRKTKNYTAIEIDKKCVEELREKFGNITILEKDYLKVSACDFPEKYKIIGNIPYNITSKILFKIFSLSDRVHEAVIMVQKEYAARMTSHPNTKDYGIIAVQTQFFSKPKFLFSVPPTAFFPKPDVTSAIVRMEFPGEMMFEIKNVPLFQEFIRESFSHRRKTLKNSLNGFFQKYEIDSDITDFDFSVRAETLTPADFIKLFTSLKL